jgi:hypothetical protein
MRQRLPSLLCLATTPLVTASFAAAQLAAGAAGGVYLSPGSVAGQGVHPAAWVEVADLRGRGLRFEGSAMAAFRSPEGASVVLGPTVGVGYVASSRRFSISAGPAALIPLGGGGSDFFPGGYVGLRWVFATSNRLGVYAHIKEYLVAGGGEFLPRLSGGVGLMRLPVLH